MLSTFAEVKRINDILDLYELPSGEDDCNIKIEEISEIRNMLIERGFNRFFSPSLKGIENVSKNEIKDIKKQLKQIRYMNYLKKSTMKRLDYAMASYKIALLHFKSGVMENSYRHLPYDGNIMDRIAKLGSTAAHVYFEIYDMLSGDVKQIGISVDVAVPSEQGVKYEKLQLYGVNNLDDYLFNLYGKGVEIIKTRIIKKHKSLLTSKNYRKVLACAYASNVMREGELSLKSEDEEVNKYFSILRKFKICEPVRIDLLKDDISEQVIEELISNNLAYYENGKLYLNEELANKVNAIANRRYWNYVKKSYTKIVLDFTRLITLTTKNVRKSLGIFSFDDDIVLLKPIIEKAENRGLPNLQAMIEDKYKIEKSIGFADKKIGLALFAYYYGKQKLKALFNIDFSEIADEYKIVETFLTKKGRGEKFLEHIKK